MWAFEKHAPGTDCTCAENFPRNGCPKTRPHDSSVASETLVTLAMSLTEGTIPQVRCFVAYKIAAAASDACCWPRDTPYLVTVSRTLAAARSPSMSTRTH